MRTKAKRFERATWELRQIGESEAHRCPRVRENRRFMFIDDERERREEGRENHCSRPHVGAVFKRWKARKSTASLSACLDPTSSSWTHALAPFRKKRKEFNESPLPACKDWRCATSWNAFFGQIFMPFTHLKPISPMASCRPVRFCGCLFHQWVVKLTRSGRRGYPDIVLSTSLPSLPFSPSHFLPLVLTTQTRHPFTSDTTLTFNFCTNVRVLAFPRVCCA